MSKYKIIRACTVPQSLGFVKGMLSDLQEKYEVVLLSSSGSEWKEIRQSYPDVKCIELNMDRHISLVKDIKSLWNMWRTFHKEKPRMVHSMTPKAGLLCMVAAWMAGVGIEYLLQEGFVEGDADEILWQIDCRVFNTINSRAIGTLGIGKGICGLAYYLYYRLSRRKGEEDIKVLRMKEHLIYLIDWIADSLPGVRESSLFEEVFFILCLLHRLDVFNAKVEKLMEYCEKGMITSGREAVWI